MLAYFMVAYVLLPALWKRYTHRHPSFADIPGLTHTGDGHPGDPLNVALVGTAPELVNIMTAAKWYPADPLTFKSCLDIAVDTVLKRPDPEAPVSNLYLFHRQQDFAFEKPVDNNPRQRNHVRFWKTDRIYADGRPIWIGAAIYDEHVGLSKTTGQVTHVTGPDIDKERGQLFQDLKATGLLTEDFTVPGFHKILSGRNGGGDPWHTDGDLWAGVIK